MHTVWKFKNFYEINFLRFLISHIYFSDGNGNEAAVHDFLTSLEVNSEVWIGLHQATPLDRFHWV